VAQWLAGVAVIVLLIACANVANLLLARALRRRKEIALRIALGVGRGRLFGQLLTETLLLAAAGGVTGLIVGRVGTAALWSLFSSGSAEAPGVVDWRAMGFAAVITLLAGLLSALVPLAQNARTDVATALKAGAREGTYQKSRLRTGLLVFQGALSVVLLVGAGLFVKSLEHVRAIPLGYDADRLLYVEAHPRGGSQSDQERAATVRRLEEAARTLPGVERVSRAATVPFWSRWTTPIFVPGIDSASRLGRFSLQAGSGGYFETAGTRIVRGRGITDADRKGAPGVIVVSESMAALLWPGQDPLGRCVRVDNDTLPCNTVIGVAENIKQSALNDDPGLQFYLATDQFHPESAHLFVRTRGSAAGLREPIRLALQKEMSGASYVTAMPLREVVDPRFASWKVGARLFLAFGGMALAVAAIGLYGVIAYNVAQRTQELGLRIALGAATGGVVRMVIADGLRIAVLGIAIGAAVALVAGRWLQPLLFEQSARDPVIFGAVAAVLLLVAAAASMVPARRAARVDPTVALRAD
jgi:predicted permease